MIKVRCPFDGQIWLVDRPLRWGQYDGHNADDEYIQCPRCGRRFFKQSTDEFKSDRILERLDATDH